MSKEKVLEALNVQAVYGNEVKKSTKGHVMCCPFHAEKTPSFHIYPDLSWHCFGSCATGGDVFSFVMKRDGVEFTEALQTLADIAGVVLEKRNGGGNSKLSRVYAMNEIAMKHYNAGLVENKAALQYLLGRGITEESIRRFRLGYAPGASMIALLRKEGFRDADILESGLAGKHGQEVADFFYRRVMFPVISKGKVMGFGGRVLGGDMIPKYLNTKETVAFKKSSLLYGFDAAAIEEAGFAIQVEGYLDVVMMHQYGFRNAFAPMGTSLTAVHVEKLRKHTSRVITINDGDAAGKAATMRSAQLLFDKWMQGGAVMLPDGQDPDSFLRSGGDMAALIDNAMPFSVLLAAKLPGQKASILRNLQKRENPYALAEFLSMAGDSVDAKLMAELSARSAFERLMAKAKVVLSNGDYVVKQAGGELFVFHRGRFCLSGGEITGNGAEQAKSLLMGVMALRERKAGMAKDARRSA